MTLPAQFRQLSVRLSTILLFVFSIVLTQVPLFNSLGYEFSAGTALIVSVLSGFVTIGHFRFKSESSVSQSDFLRFCKENLLLHASFVAIPLVVISLNVLAVKNCSYLEGLAFYLLIPCVTVLFSVSLAGFCAVLFRRARIWYFVLLMLVLGHILWLGYFTPQIFSYNFVLGYFPGLSYDEVLTITPTLVLFRVATLVVGAFLFLLSRLVISDCRLAGGTGAKLACLFESFRGTWRKDHAMLMVAAAVLVALWMFRTDVGLESSNTEIEKKLDHVFRTDHFRIHYAEESFSGEDVRWAGAEHEFRFDQIARRLQVSFKGQIDSYIYPTEELKREFIGTGTTDIAKPWRREIHLDKDSWRQTLKHELVHVLAGEFGMPMIRAHYNVGLVEGLAMAAEWEYGNRTLHEYAAAMEAFGLMGDVWRLLSLEGFAVQASSVSYVLSGSFCRFLIDRYGLVRFKELYGGKGFFSVYGKEAETLAGEWRDLLSRFSVPGRWEPHIQFFFNRKSIFARECARHIAKLNGDAGRELGRRNPVRAMNMYGAALRETWNSESFAGLVRSAYVSARYDTVVALVDRQLSRNSTIANLLILYGDALWALEDVLSARKAYERALDLDLSESFTEAAFLRLFVLEDPALGMRLQPVFVGFESDSTKRRILEGVAHPSAAVDVLLAQVLYRTKRYEDALNVLGRSPSADSILGLALHRLKGMCDFRLRRFQQARAGFWQAMNFTTNEASRLRLSDWIDRCEWFDAHARSYLDSQK